MNRRDIPHPEISIAALFDDLTMLVFYMKDADGTFVRCNRRFEEFYGLAPGGAMGLTDHDLNEAGIVRGVAGVMYEISGAAGLTEPFARIKPALKLIHAEEPGPLKTAELAAACNYSESQFNRIFRSIMSNSPRRYVLRHRLETAKDLLARTGLTLSDIAGRCGFYDSSDFGKRFLEQEGLTPRKYRMKLQGMIRTEG